MFSKAITARCARSTCASIWSPFFRLERVHGAVGLLLVAVSLIVKHPGIVRPFPVCQTALGRWILAHAEHVGASVPSCLVDVSDHTQ